MNGTRRRGLESGQAIRGFRIRIWHTATGPNHRGLESGQYTRV